MRSGTSFFDKTVYWKSFTRFWPIWAANLVVWLMALPLTALMRLQTDLAVQQVGYSTRLASFARNVGDNATELGLVMALILGVLAAMAMFSHLYSSKSANFMAALPIRREGQFISHYLAGLTGLVAPNGIVFLLTLLVEAVGQQVWFLPLGYWLLAVTVMEFFFYSFAVCLAQFTGHLLALPVYYGVFNVLAMAVYTLLYEIMDLFYYGFYGFSSVWERMAYWCTPALPFAEMDCRVVQENDAFVYSVNGMGTLAAYAVAAAVLTVCALLLYRRRHMETAGDVVAVRAMRPVFKYGVAVCAGFALGILSTLILDLEEPGLMAAIVVWAVVGYFVAQMFLDKSFRVFRKWKGAAAVAVCFLLLFAVIAFDLTGFETRVPRADQVVSVDVEGLSGDVYDSANHLDETVTDPVVVERIIALHQAAVDNRSDEVPIPADSQYATWRVTLRYTLKNGTAISRQYDLWDVDTNATVPGTVWYAVEQIVSDRDFMWQVYGFPQAEELEGQGAVLAYAEFNSEKYTDYPRPTKEYEDMNASFSGEQARALLEAVKTDYALGNIGRDTAKRDMDAIVGSLVFEWELEEAQPTEVGLGYSVTDSFYYQHTQPVTVRNFYLEILVTEDSAHTLAALEELTAPVIMGEGTETYPVWVWTEGEQGG